MTEQKINVQIRKWALADAKNLANALSNPKVLDNLHDGLPYPYAEEDGRVYISAMMAANPNDTSAVTANGQVLDMKMCACLKSF